MQTFTSLCSVDAREREREKQIGGDGGVEKSKANGAVAIEERREKR